MVENAFERSLSDSGQSQPQPVAEQGEAVWARNREPYHRSVQRITRRPAQPVDDGAIPAPKRLEAVEDILTDIHTRTENALLAARSALHDAEEARREAEEARREALKARHLAERNTARIMANEILARAAGQDDSRPPSHAKPKRGRQGLRLIPGGMAAIVPAALLALRWAFCSGARRAAKAAVALTAAGTTVAAPAVMSSAASPPPSPVVAHHDRDRRAQPPPLFAAPAARRRRCHDHDQVTVLAAGAERCRETDRDSRAVAGASPLPSPVPSPASTTPVPGPTATPVPTPTAPVPTPTPTLPVPTPSATGPAGAACQLLPPLCKRGQ